VAQVAQEKFLALLYKLFQEQLTQLQLAQQAQVGLGHLVLMLVVHLVEVVVQQFLMQHLINLEVQVVAEESVVDIVEAVLAQQGQQQMLQLEEQRLPH
jgi:hypothetical protein